MNRNSTCPGQKGHELGLSCHLKLLFSITNPQKAAWVQIPKRHWTCQPPKSTADPQLMTTEHRISSIQGALRAGPLRTQADPQKPALYPATTHYTIK